ncbi:MAG: cytochrome c oxidase subunit II [Acidobacteria bacterium 13_1_20CM_3_53_8]|nr:MAG: cytochrome c oxidase subunit II [Acidobacteria bacterium 13_1_20CM_3_53_8]
MGRALGVLIWLITLGSVLLFASGKWWFPATISEHGPEIDRQFMRTIIVVGISFVAAQVALGWAVWKYRATPGDTTRAVYSHGNNRLEIIWTVVTAVVFISLAVIGQRVWAQLHFVGAPAGSYQVEVVAQQFQWNFHYAGVDGQFGRTDPSLIGSSNLIGLDPADPKSRDDAVLATLVLPVNRPVELTLRSIDVTHSFWVPPLRFKQDLVPGMAIHVHFTPTKTGQYELACAELCGQFHYRMRGYVIILPQDEHNALMALPPDQFQTRVGQLRQQYPIVY